MEEVWELPVMLTIVHVVDNSQPDSNSILGRGNILRSVNAVSRVLTTLAVCWELGEVGLCLVLL